MSADYHRPLSDSEVGIIKGVFRHYPERFTSQDILNRFSRPERTINFGRISEIKNGHERYANIPPASKDEVDKFLSKEGKPHKLAENRLSNSEVGIIKRVFRYYPERFTSQDILSKFSTPERTINAGRISEIKNGHERYANIPPASKDEVDEFFSE